MTNEAKLEGINNAVEKAKRKGSIDSVEILDIVAEFELDMELTEKLYEMLDAAGVEIEGYMDTTGLEEIEKEVGRYESAEDMEQMLVKDGLSVDDPVRLYLKEIGVYPLLTPEKEAELAVRVAQGDKEAKDEFVNSNLRLVVSIAKKYTASGMTFLDCVQEGNLGLIKAVGKFDPDKGYKFSTYATWWIRQAITRSIAENGKTIRLPNHMVELINKISRVSRRFLQENGREPTHAEIALELDTTEEKINEAIRVSIDPTSLDKTVGEDEDSRLGDFIEDTQALSPEDVACSNLLRITIFKVLHMLSYREEQVIRLRYGLDYDTPKTLEEIGLIFDITRERVRQIEAKALRKLRHPAFAKLFKGFI